MKNKAVWVMLVAAFIGCFEAASASVNIIQDALPFGAIYINEGSTTPICYGVGIQLSDPSITVVINMEGPAFVEYAQLADGLILRINPPATALDGDEFKVTITAIENTTPTSISIPIKFVSRGVSLPSIYRECPMTDDGTGISVSGDETTANAQAEKELIEAREAQEAQLYQDYLAMQKKKEADDEASQFSIDNIIGSPYFWPGFVGAVLFYFAFIRTHSSFSRAIRGDDDSFAEEAEGGFVEEGDDDEDDETITELKSRLVSTHRSAKHSSWRGAHARELMILFITFTLCIIVLMLK